MFYSISGLGGEVFVKSTECFWLNFHHVVCPKHSSLSHSLTGACISPCGGYSIFSI